MTALATRPIAPISFDGIVCGEPATSPPTDMWVSPTELLVDAAYQRDLSDRSLKLIRKIVESWDWRRFKPPVVVMTDDGFEVVDGQHTALAAASHPAIDRILVVVIEAKERSDRASAFIGHNRDRLAMTAAQMHTAAVVAGEADAVVVQQVADRTGIRILRGPPSGGAYKPGDTQAVAAITSLIKSRGERGARTVLELLSKAGLTPVSAEAIRAADLLVHDDEFAGWFAPEALTKTIVDMGATAGQEAGVFAATHCVRRWRGLASVWFKNVKKLKERAPAVTDVGNPVFAAAPEAGDRASEHRPNVAEEQKLTPITEAPGHRRAAPEPRPRIVPFTGEPPPGRSALDQRRAEQAKGGAR